MKKVLDKKGQVDVALAIGSVIVPVAALIGALIFAFASIADTANAFKLASLISYDVSTIRGVAYSVPDDVAVYYTPPSQCDMGESEIVCDEGNLIISGVRYEVKTSELNSKEREETYGTETQLSMKIKTLPGVSAMGFRADADSNDYLMRGGADNIDMTDGLKIEKKNDGLFDTISTDSYIEGEDFLFEIVRQAYAACNSGDEQTLELFVPVSYGLVKKSNKITLIHLGRDDGLVEDAPMRSLYTVNLNELQDLTGCTYVFKGILEDKNAFAVAYNKPNGLRLNGEITYDDQSSRVTIEFDETSGGLEEWNI